MKKFSALIAFLAFVPALVSAQTTAPKLSGHPSAAEAPFVNSITSDLQARFPTPASAMKAHYIRFTDEDDTGAISYANEQWNSTDPAHPSQLWYDVNGRLIGADYSVPIADSPSQPKLWGVDPARWQKFGAHIHFGVRGPNGTTTYGAMHVPPSGQATFADVVAAGKAKSTSDVRFVFLFPAIWDLEVWLIPNPNGAFAEKNPDLKPSPGAKASM